MGNSRTRLFYRFTKAVALASYWSHNTWGPRPKDMLIYSINIECKVSKPGQLVLWEHGEVGSGLWLSYEEYTHGSRHQTNQSALTFRYDRPEVVKKDETIQFAGYSNEDSEEIYILVEYEWID